MVIGTLALTGFPFTAGYFSKDAIIEAAFAGKNPFAVYAFVMTVIAAGLTAFYSWRLIFKTFHGEPHDQHHYEAAQESPLVILIPLGVLAVGSIVAGLPVQGIFRRPRRRAFLPRVDQAERDDDRRDAPRAARGSRWLPTVMMVLGWGVVGLLLSLPAGHSGELARQHDVLYRFLLNKWYFDEIYDFLFVRPALWLGRVFWKGGDG